MLGFDSPPYCDRTGVASGLPVLLGGGYEHIDEDVQGGGEGLGSGRVVSVCGFVPLVIDVCGYADMSGMAGVRIWRSAQSRDVSRSSRT